jgi:hypothetical protein
MLVDTNHPWISSTTAHPPYNKRNRLSFSLMRMLAPPVVAFSNFTRNSKLESSNIAFLSNNENGNQQTRH